MMAILWEAAYPMGGCFLGWSVAWHTFGVGAILVMSTPYNVRPATPRKFR
jgi:hypothetical protein